MNLPPKGTLCSPPFVQLPAWNQILECLEAHMSIATASKTCACWGSPWGKHRKTLLNTSGPTVPAEKHAKNHIKNLPTKLYSSHLGKRTLGHAADDEAHLKTIRALLQQTWGLSTFNCNPSGTSWYLKYLTCSQPSTGLSDQENLNSFCRWKVRHRETLAGSSSIRILVCLGILEHPGRHYIDHAITAQDHPPAIVELKKFTTDEMTPDQHSPLRKKEWLTGWL